MVVKKDRPFKRGTGSLHYILPPVQSKLVEALCKQTLINVSLFASTVEPIA